MIFEYVRVSTKEQNIDRQLKALLEYASELQDSNIYIDKESERQASRGHCYC